MKLLIAGFFGEQNLGDEAILEGILREVGMILPAQTPIWVTAGQQRAAFPGEPPSQTPSKRDLGSVSGGPPSLGRGIRDLGSVSGGPIPRKGFLAWPHFVRAAAQSSHFLTSGGILQDWSWDGTLFFALRILAARMLGCRIGIIGAGIGPLRGVASRSISALALKTAGTIWVRDTPSAELVKHLTGRTPNLGVDWSWNLDPSALEPDNIVTEKKTAINLRPWFDRRWVKKIAEHIHTTISPTRRLGIPARPEDERLLQQFFPDMPKKSCATFSELLGFSNHALSRGIAMRYHVIMALIRMHVPLLALAYDQKVLHLCREAGIEPWQVQDNTVPAFQTAQPAFFSTTQQRLQKMQAGLREFLDGPTPEHV